MTTAFLWIDTHPAVVLWAALFLGLALGAWAVTAGRGREG